MLGEKKFIKVYWLKAHWDFSYSAGMTGMIDAERAADLFKKGFILPVPEEEGEKVPEPAEKVNSLPADMPGRDKLFANGFDTVEKIKEVSTGEGLLDVGISVAMLKKIKKYFKA